VLFQKMNGAAVVGTPVAIPAEYDGAYLALSEDGITAGTRKPTFTIHYGDFPEGVRPKGGDRLVVGTGEAAGTYDIDHYEENGDRTGAVLIVRRH
jgi:hypothetical protein